MYFSVGEMVYLRLQDQTYVGIGIGRHGKMAPRYVGKFEVIKRVGKLAYRLRFPDTPQW